jgi:hypothetical protein
MTNNLSRIPSRILVLVGAVTSAVLLCQEPPIALKEVKVVSVLSLSRLSPFGANNGNGPDRGGTGIHERPQLRASSSGYYVLQTDHAGQHIFMFDTAGSYKRTVELGQTISIGEFDVSSSGEKSAIQEVNPLNRSTHLSIFDSNGIDIDEIPVPRAGSRVLWSEQSILTIGGRLLSTVDTLSKAAVTKYLPAEVDGDHSLVIRISRNQVLFVNPYDARMTIVNESAGAAIPISLTLQSPELTAARAIKSAAPDSPTQRTLLIACASGDDTGHLYLVPTGYQISRGIPVNEFDERGALIQRYLLANPALNGLNALTFVPAQIGVSGRRAMLLSSMGEIAIYEIPS